MARIKKRVAEREVDDLFNADAIFEEAALQLSPAVVAYYRSKAPYAFAVERQSEGMRVLGDPEKTGHEGRVSTIRHLTRGLYLPEPEVRPNRQKGQTPYILDERFWFVDGETAKATGWSARPEVRPRLWMAYALARKLKQIDPEAAPSAFIFGDPTRFFREDQWLRVWARAIINEGIMLLVEGFDGPVDELKLEMMALQVKFQSMHFPQSRAKSKEVFRAQAKFFDTQVPYGFEVVNRTDIATVPGTYEVFPELCQRLYDGRLTNCQDAARWIRATFGDAAPKSDGWIRRMLREFEELWVEGTYWTYRNKSIPCKIKQRHGPNWELDFAPNGARRYVLKEQPKEHQVKKRVQYAEGHAPIPRPIFQGARDRILRRGSPETVGVSYQRLDSILSSSVLRCAVCGSAVLEYSPHRTRRHGQEGAWRPWSLSCLCVQRYKKSECITAKQARELDARWAGARLPTELEWELAARRLEALPTRGNFADRGAFHPVPAPDAAVDEPLQMYGDVWEWTASNYNAYPGYRPLPGAVGEYNGKFMCNQFVLRGGSCATPAGHVRASYRNFFPPEAQWQFSGLRLARDA